MQAERSPHKQVWVKVNARVDEGIAPLVEALAEFPWIETTGSCQGETGNPEWGAHVYFFCGDWRRAAVFVHAHLAPMLSELAGGEAVRMYASGCGDPLIEVRLSAEATPVAASAVRQLAGRLRTDHN